MAAAYSIIIPAFNEEALLASTLTFVRRAMESEREPGEIVVVDNNSTDATRAVAASMGCRIVFEPVNQISRARNRGAAAATGDLLIFLDADTRLSPELLSTALARLAQGTCCGGGAVMSFFENDQLFLAQAALRLVNGVTRWISVAGGSFIFCTRTAFDAVGGFSEKVYAGEDVLFSRKLRLWGSDVGQTFEIIRDFPIQSSDRKFRWHSSGKLLLMAASMLIFPFGVRFKRLCGLWYTRPQ